MSLVHYDVARHSGTTAECAVAGNLQRDAQSAEAWRSSCDELLQPMFSH